MNSRNELVIIVLMHLLLYVAIGFDIPVFRQVVAFVYLSVVPGFALLKVLKLRQISAFDTLLFSVGLSIASSMFVGLLVNTLFPLIGILQPLTLIPLATVLGFYTLLLYFIGSRHELLEPLTAKSWRAINLDTRTVVLTLPPILSIIGAVYGNVPILLIMLVITGTIMFLSISFERFVPAKLFPITIFAVSAALALHFSLISQHIIGYDAPLEYYVFKTTELSSHWSIIENVAYPIVTNFSSLLSVSILPTVYSSFMSIDGEILFKVFYPFVFSLVPVTLYRIFETQMSKRVALISVFLFVSGSLVFFGVEPLSLNRQIVAEFFLVLSVFILLEKTIPTWTRRLLLIIFGFAMIISHYSITYIFLVYIIVAFLVIKARGKQDEVLSGKMVLLLSVIAFSWYSYVSLSPLVTVESFLSQLSSRFLSDVFNPAARSNNMFVVAPVSTFASVTNWAFFYMAHFLVLLGILGVFLKPQNTRFSPFFRTMIILSGIILLVCVVVPNFATALNFSRFYALTFLFLSPCFYLGGATLFGMIEGLGERINGKRYSQNLFSQMAKILIVVALIGYFFTQTGFINHMTNAAPNSYSLDLDRKISSGDISVRIDLYGAYHPEEEYASAVWLSTNGGNQSRIYSDQVSLFHLLYDHSRISFPRLEILTNSSTLDDGDCVYLRTINVVDGIVGPSLSDAYNITEISPLLGESNEVYANGLSEVFIYP